jgi:hypothetical protein
VDATVKFYLREQLPPWTAIAFRRMTWPANGAPAPA